MTPPSFTASHSKANSINPPLHPESSVSQSTKYCSEKVLTTPLFWAYKPSKLAVVANDQHDPHEPWSFTGATTPLSLQSKASGAALETFAWTGFKLIKALALKFKFKYVLANSCLVKSENLVTPVSKDWGPFEVSLIRFCLKTLYLARYSLIEEYFLLYYLLMNLWNFL